MSDFIMPCLLLTEFEVHDEKSEHLFIYSFSHLNSSVVLLYSCRVLSPVLPTLNRSEHPTSVLLSCRRTASLQQITKQSIWDIQESYANVTLPFIGKGWNCMYFYVL